LVAKKEMGKEMEHYSFGGYKYAPESVRFTLNGKLLNLPEELRSILAYKAVCGQKKEVVDGLKRFVRQQRRESDIEGITYGFYGTGTNEYYFTRDLIIPTDSNLEDKVRAYKAWKQYLSEKDCIVELPYIVEEGEVMPNGMQSPEARLVVASVDLIRPVKVLFRKERMVA